MSTSEIWQKEAFQAARKYLAETRRLNLLCGLMILAGISISGIVQADHHGHVGVEFIFGMPYPSYYYPPPYYYYYYPYPYYYPPAVAVPAPAQPPVYIEQGSAQPAPQQAPATPENFYWYHCDKPDGYYPYIRECPSGWQKVAPTPPPQH
jgi:hypothetical protein